MNPETGLTPNEIKSMLSLERHPTCGFVAETYRSSLMIPASALPNAYESDRPYASALYFLVTLNAQIVMHRIRSDQLYHHYLGDPLEVLMLYPGGGAAIVTVGPDLRSGMRPQLLIPGGTFHTSRLGPGEFGWALLASTEWPGVEPTDVEHGDIDALTDQGLSRLPRADPRVCEISPATLLRALCSECFVLPLRRALRASGCLIRIPSES